MSVPITFYNPKFVSLQFIESILNVISSIPVHEFQRASGVLRSKLDGGLYASQTDEEGVSYPKPRPHERVRAARLLAERRLYEKRGKPSAGKSIMC